ncbi:MAG: MFS transporter [Nevskiaceae bacterium]|nr:MFS transporter [Nevskiaceae bacterium]
MSARHVSTSSALLRHRPFQFYFWGRLFSNLSRQMVAVAVGWQVYALTNSALHLGMIGLAQFLPTALLTFHGGHAADRFDRKRVVQLCQWGEAAAAAVLALGTLEGWLTVTHIYLAAAVFGVTTAFERPAGAAMLPNVVPDRLLQQGTALSSGAMQFATISGPALGGLIYAYAPVALSFVTKSDPTLRSVIDAYGPGATYATTAAFWLLAGLLNGLTPVARHVGLTTSPTWRSLFAGVGFVWRNPMILGTISLDLFAVLLGGATALLPIFAADVLHTGPVGLGLLRSAPALGALAVTVMLARRPLQSRVGLRMFQAVIIFGCATIVFGLSTELWLSLIALVVMGAGDEVSVVIRLSLVQLKTPDDMRGRVSAVNFLFVNASNQLGEFESGVVAALIGAVPAVLVGGAGSVLIALLWMKLFPSLRNVERLV